MPPTRRLAALLVATLVTASACAPGTRPMTSDEVMGEITKFVKPLMPPGEIDDNADHAAYLAYLEANQDPKTRKLDVTDRRTIQVADADGKAVANAVVAVTADGKAVFTGRTLADGRVLFHPSAVAAAKGAKAFEVTATKGAERASATFQETGPDTWDVRFAKALTVAPATLDVLFLIDTTASMSWEIKRMQTTVKSIADRIAALEGRPKLRLALVAYRDRGDDYVVQKTDFTTNVAAFQQALAGLKAAQGGDYPEDVEAALKAAVNDLAWDANDGLRLAFLIGDAPPHIDYADGASYLDTATKAVEKGIKFHMIGTLLLQPVGMYVMRQVAQLSRGRFMYTTHEGPDGVAQAVGKYGEGRLDDIVVDLVKEEIAGLGQVVPTPASPRPAVSASPMPSPGASTTPSPAPAASASPVASAGPSPSPSASPASSASPSASPSAEASPGASPSPDASPSPTASASTTP